jgi:hypothetical protein
MTTATTPTIYGSYLQSVTYQQRPFVLMPKTTLNEHLDIIKDLEIPPNVYPKPHYIAIGQGGHRNVNDGDIESTEDVIHRSTDSVLYKQAPFVLRELNDDLDDARRQRYALRKIENYNGIDYIAYYLRRLDFNQTDTVMKLIVTNNGNVTEDIFVPSNDNMNPIPPVVIADGTNDTNSKQVVVESLTDFVFDAFDRDEFVNAIRIRTGKENMAIISEIALCSGIDKQHTGPVDGGSVQYDEVQACQINYFISARNYLHIDTQGFSKTLNIGGSDPLYVED